MSTDYTYDEDGSLFPFFAFTLSTITTLPATYFLLKGCFSDPSKLFPRIQTDYRPKHADLVDAQRSKDRRRSRRLGLTIFVLLGWAVMIYTAYLIHYVEAPVAQRVWNPYDILGISEVRLAPGLHLSVVSLFVLHADTDTACSQPPKKPSSPTTRSSL